MLKDSQGRRLWIKDEYGQHTPVKSHADIAKRPRGQAEPDWWVVAKDPTWTPPEPRSLLSLGVTDSDGAGGAGGEGDAGAPAGGHTKIGAGHKPQSYDAHGRYTGPRGGSIAMDGGTVRIYADEADESPDSNESAGEDTGGKPEEAPEPEEEATQELMGVLVADSGQIMSDAGGGLSGGNEVRGPVTPPSGNVIPPAPPTPVEPHLTYSQHWGELRDSEDKTIGVGYSGKGETRDNGELEGQKDKGPIPRGNYKVAEIVNDPNDPRNQKMGPHILRLEPADQQTKDRLASMNRDGFYIHGGGENASTGCIIMGRTVREGIPQGTIIHVQR